MIPPDLGTTQRHTLNRFAKQEGIEGAIAHTFRHTVSTLVQESGDTRKAAQELLGHSSSSTRHRVDTHTSSDTMDRIADALQSIFGDADVDIPDPDDVIFDEKGPDPRKPAAASQNNVRESL